MGEVKQVANAPVFRRTLELRDAATIVMGSMIGSGVFIVAADIARQTQSATLLLATWAITTVMTLLAALAYGELAAALPQAGGQYVYLREAFGPLTAFLYGWTLFFVIQTGTIAAVAVAFGKFLGVLVPSLTGYEPASAIIILIFLSWVNSLGVETGAAVQRIFTAAKILALAGLIIAGLLAPGHGQAINWSVTWSPDLIRIVGVAMVGALFSADAWNNVTFIAGEMRNPRRDVPLGLTIGVGTVCGLYLLANYVYLRVLPLAAIQNAAQDRVGTAAANAIFGSFGYENLGSTLMAVAILISTFGCVNGMSLAGARAYYAMARDGLFFKAAGNLNPRTNVPTAALWIQCLWACLLTLSGKYGDLLDYVIFAVLLFYVATIVALYVLRAKRPDLERPYRAIGYPVLPALYIVLAAAIEVLLLLYKPQYTWPGLAIVLAGVPVYYIWRKMTNNNGGNA